MPLEQQVVSLELAKELKELGYPQESLFYWHYSYNPTTKQINKPYLLFNTGINKEELETNISAPTVAELGEVLKEKYPMCVEGETIVSGKWKIDSFEADTEADARAKALIYLLKNKLIELK